MYDVTLIRMMPTIQGSARLIRVQRVLRLLCNVKRPGKCTYPGDVRSHIYSRAGSMLEFNTFPEMYVNILVYKTLYINSTGCVSVIITAGRRVKYNATPDTFPRIRVV